jgi:hypothetical protein
MVPDQWRWVKQIGRVLLVVVFVTLGSITTLGLGPPPPTTTTSPSPQQARNDHIPALTTTPTVTYSRYFPLIYHNYMPPLPLINGNFATCDQTGWDTGQGPFAGHGSGLPQAVVSFEGSCRAQIGDPSAQHGAIPVGSGYLAQTFTVDKRYLKFRYRILTNDIIRGAQTGRYFDTFEVSLNTPPNQISDNERNDKGCSTTLLNPTGTIIPTEGLVLCGGHNGPETDAGTLRDLDWKEVTLDMQNFQQKNITLYFALWSREYEPDHYNDQALHNTVIYIDDVQLFDPCPSADGTGTVAPAIAIDSITFFVNDDKQVLRDDDVLHASPGDQVEVKEVIICAEPFDGRGGRANIEFTPVDKNGQLESEIKESPVVTVTAGLTTIPVSNIGWTLGDKWQHISVVTVHYPHPPNSEYDPTCGDGECERDDLEIFIIDK